MSNRCQGCGGDLPKKNKKFCSKECCNKAPRKKTAKRSVCRNPYCVVVVKKSHLKYCSIGCCRDDPFLYRKSTKGTKQSQETIAKRIANTDQSKKEAKRKETMLGKYGVENCSQLLEVKEKTSLRMKGKEIPRTEEHQKKIIESKIRSGKVKHTENTKKKISVALRKFHDNPDTDKSIFLSRPKGKSNYKTGYLHGLYYRSSYEKMFIAFCHHYDIKISSAESKEHSVNYVDREGGTRTYFPDFYLEDSGTVVEIKPRSMLDYRENPTKIEQGLKEIDNYLLLTELDGFLYEKEWEDMYESSFKYL